MDMLYAKCASQGRGVQPRLHSLTSKAAVRQTLSIGGHAVHSSKRSSCENPAYTDTVHNSPYLACTTLSALDRVMLKPISNILLVWHVQPFVPPLAIGCLYTGIAVGQTTSLGVALGSHQQFSLYTGSVTSSIRCKDARCTTQ
eukprot:1138038-Pelagomonas_calceolata.AAC.1